MHIEMIILALVLVYIVIQATKYLLYKRPSRDTPCYDISTSEGTSLFIQDSQYIIDKIGYYVGQGSKDGLCDININIDLRYTSASSIYKAIGVIESNGMKVSEKPSISPTRLMFNIRFNEI
jgi:hypothetical protein